MSTRLQRTADDRARAARRGLAEQLERLIGDAGIHHRQLAAEAGIARSYLGRILRNEARPTLETYARLGAALGADLAIRYYPNTGPHLHDRWQAPMLEQLLGDLHPRWEPLPELPVRRPGRGWIDVGLHDARAQLLLATELQSELRRLEQLVRWHALKADSLPSWEGWPHLPEPPAVSRLLVVRRTRATRQVAAEFARQLRIAYPAHPDDALAALTSTVPWPGAALVWMAVDARGVRWVPGR